MFYPPAQAASEDPKNQAIKKSRNRNPDTRRWRKAPSTSNAELYPLLFGAYNVFARRTGATETRDMASWRAYDIPNERTTHVELKRILEDWWKAQYSADRMQLCVVSSGKLTSQTLLCKGVH